MKTHGAFIRLGSLKACTKGGNGNDYDCCFRGTYYQATEDEQEENIKNVRVSHRAKRNASHFLLNLIH